MPHKFQHVSDGFKVDWAKVDESSEAVGLPLTAGQPDTEDPSNGELGSFFFYSLSSSSNGGSFPWAACRNSCTKREISESTTCPSRLPSKPQN